MWGGTPVWGQDYIGFGWNGKVQLCLCLEWVGGLCMSCFCSIQYNNVGDMVTRRG